MSFTLSSSKSSVLKIVSNSVRVGSAPFASFTSSVSSASSASASIRSAVKWDPSFPILLRKDVAPSVCCLSSRSTLEMRLKASTDSKASEKNRPKKSLFGTIIEGLWKKEDGTMNNHVKSNDVAKKNNKSNGQGNEESSSTIEGKVANSDGADSQESSKAKKELTLEEKREAIDRILRKQRRQRLLLALKRDAQRKKKEEAEVNKDTKPKYRQTSPDVDPFSRWVKVEEPVRVTSILGRVKHLPTSYRKVNMVLRLIRKLPVGEAIVQLQMCHKRLAIPILNCMRVTAINAKHNLGLDLRNVYVSRAIVGRNSPLKRPLPQGRGRHGIMQRQASNVEIVLSQGPPPLPRKTAIKKHLLTRYIPYKNVTPLRQVF